MKKNTKIAYALIVIAFILFIALHGNNRQSTTSIKIFLSKNKIAIEQIKDIKKRLFIESDSILFFQIEYTGKMFFTINQNINESNWIVNNFLSKEETNYIKNFMHREKLHDIVIYKDKIKYFFNGSDCMVITDRPSENEGTEIEKNVYFHPWSIKENN